jgi:hypothetical protein
MNLFDAIEKLITEHGSAAILRERIAQAKEQQAALEKENASLKTENARLASDLQKAQSEIQHLKPTGMVENDGLLWKRTPSGFDRRPYCPRCDDHPVMMEFPPGSRELWACPSDHTFAYDSHPPTA